MQLQHDRVAGTTGAQNHSGLDQLLDRLQDSSASARREQVYEDELGRRWRPGYAPDGLPDGSLRLVAESA